METQPPTASSAAAGDGVAAVDATTDLQHKQLVEALSHVDKDLAAVAAAEEFLLKNEPVEMLPYQHEMFVDVMQSDCLVVCAKGLNYNDVVVNLLLAHSDPGNLVLVINSADYEENYFKSKLNSNLVHDSATNAKERETNYLLGGIQFLTTRILIVDLLKRRIPIELITGIVVLRAHKIIESCQEAFALRLYRQNNRTGFVKAFSQCAEAFTYGYGHVEKVMRNLFVRELYVWPRFHASVQRTLRPFESQCVELHVPISSHQQQIQANVLDIMNLMVKELKRINRFVDLQEVTVENCITKRFHKIMQAQLDCMWHQLSGQTKQLVADLKVLRSIMISTIYSDPITLYAQLRHYRSHQYAHNSSGWILSDAADQMFRLSRERVFNSDGEFEPEPCPKWRALSELLRVEIPSCVRRATDRNPNALSEPVKVLVLCQDARTCHQLNQYLTLGGERHLLYTALKNDVQVTAISERYRVVQEVDAATASIVLSTDRSSAVLPPTPAPAATVVAPATPAGGSTKTTRNSGGGFLRDRIAAKRKQADKATSSSKRTTVSAQDASESGAADLDDDDDEKMAAGNSSKSELSMMLTVRDDEATGFGDCTMFRDAYILTMTQTATGDQTALEENGLNQSTDSNGGLSVAFETFAELDNLNVTQLLHTIRRPVVCIQTFKSAEEGGQSLERTLAELRPGFVVMFHSSVTAIRQLEVYEARRQRPAHARMHIFFLMHSQTVEEQSYLTNLRREKQAFELLIETKRTMVVPEGQDGKSDDTLLAIHRQRNADNCPDEAPGQLSINPRIIVDMREFRSELPCLIHRRGIEVVPVTIAIGDYILTPEICVERKSISDLIGSLNSGRLYNQCVQMQRHYARPILLIEFDQNKPFHLQGHYMASAEPSGGGSSGSGSGDTNNADIVQKLQLLTLHFPRLRLVWSPSPYATAQLFEELKLNRAEPDAVQAAAHGSDESAAGTKDGGSGADAIDNFADRINATLYDFLLKLPGITAKNVMLVLRKVKDMKELLQYDEAALAVLLGNHLANAKMLWQILNVVHKPEAETVAAVGAFGKNFRRGGMARRF